MAYLFIENIEKKSQEECWTPDCRRKSMRRAFTVVHRDDTEIKHPQFVEITVRGARFHAAQLDNQQIIPNRKRERTFPNDIKQELTPKDKFLKLAKQWKKETAMSSLVIDKITNTNYLAIIGMGTIYKKEVLKFILDDLQEGVEFWHYALKSISESNPVPKGMVKDLNIVRDYWLDWGNQNGLIK